MSFIRDHRMGDDIDTHGTAGLLNDTRVTDQQKDAAWATLARHGALDLGPMLGITTEGVTA